MQGVRVYGDWGDGYTGLPASLYTALAPLRYEGVRLKVRPYDHICVTLANTRPPGGDSIEVVMVLSVFEAMR